MPGSVRHTVRGTPISELKDSCAATVGPSPASTCAIRSLVLVLPDEPVTATTVRSWPAASTTSRASSPNAVSVSSTTTCATGTSTSRCTSATSAPASWAAPT